MSIVDFKTIRINVAPMNFRETPDHRFKTCPIMTAPNYAVDDDEGGMINMHYIEAGKNGPPVVIHGNPTCVSCGAKLATTGRRAAPLQLT